MKSVSIIVASAVVLAGSAQAELIAYWDFNAPPTTPAGGDNNHVWPDTIASAQGVGSLDLSGWGTAGPEDGRTGASAGSTINALAGVDAGDALSLIWHSNDSDTNGDHFDLVFSTAGLEDLQLTYAVNHNSSPTWDTITWSYTTTTASGTIAGNYITAPANTSYEKVTVDLSGIVAVNQQATVTLRATLSGASAVPPLSGGDNVRIDNIQLNATAVPEPGAFALIATGGVLMAGRRRLTA